jgi:hypothetical protein
LVQKDAPELNAEVTEEDKTKLSMVLHACHGPLNLHISMAILHRNTRMMDLSAIIAETLEPQVKTFGATLLIQKRDGNIALHLKDHLVQQQQP